MTEYTYNENNQLLQAGESTFEYDDNGNIICEIRPNEEREYVYDAANRLRAVMFGDDSYVLYGYDGLDRKVTRESGMWRTLGNPHDGGGHPGQGHGPRHDGHPGQGNNPHDEHPGQGNNPHDEHPGRGNNPERGFEREDHPGQGNAWGINRRGEGKEKMEVVESRYFYEGMSHVLHKEYKPSGSPLAEFYVGPNNRVVSQKMFGYSGRSIPGHDPSMKTTGGLMFYHFDGMSSVSELTDRHGDVIQHYRHDAFGALFTGITAPYNTNSYTGHQYDQDVGLIDMRARWYDASIGRFLQEDTYPGTLDNPLSQNRYAYVMNNPMNFWDPTGRVPEGIDSLPYWVPNNSNYEQELVNTVEERRWIEWTFRGYDSDITERERILEEDLKQYIRITYQSETYERWDYDYLERVHQFPYTGEFDIVNERQGSTTFERYLLNVWHEYLSAKDLEGMNRDYLERYGYPQGRVEMLFRGFHFAVNGVSKNVGLIVFEDRLRNDSHYSIVEDAINRVIHGVPQQLKQSPNYVADAFATLAGVFVGRVEFAWDAIKAIVSHTVPVMAFNAIRDPVGWYEGKRQESEAFWTAVLNPGQTYNDIKDYAVESWNTNVIEGSAYDRGKWLGYTSGAIGTAVVAPQTATARTSATTIRVVNQGTRQGNLTGSLSGLTQAERRVVDDLLGQGKNVEIIPTSPRTGVKTPDFKVNGVPTELKTLANPNTNTGMKRIRDGFNQNAEAVIIDGRSANLTQNQAQEIIQRAAGKYPNKKLPGSVEIWTNNGVITYP